MNTSINTTMTTMTTIAAVMTTNPWAKSSHAVITITQGDENEMWDYGNHLLENRDNRGRNEGGSYLVYALLDYVVSEDEMCYLGGFLRGCAALFRGGDSEGGGDGRECIKCLPSMRMGRIERSR